MASAASNDKSKAGRKPEVTRSLGVIVQREARRQFSEAQLAPDPALVAAGWQRRFTADRQRIQEMTALYEQLGYDVRTEPVRADEMGEECDDCQLLILLQFRTIYTRKKR